MRKRRSHLGLRHAALAAAAAICLLPAAGLARAESEGLILDTEPPGLFLLYTGDVIGYIEPCG